MSHIAPPTPDELPRPAQLRRWSVVAIGTAAAIGICVVLPAERGVDPTGLGAILGLTEMGQIKQELAAEAEADALIHGDDGASLLDWLGLAALAQTLPQETVTFTLAPGEATEVKFVMEAGATLSYRWEASGGRINFDLHAHGEGESVDYDRGRGETEGEGQIEAPFAGEHGWFWRNRDDADVTITLTAEGQFSEVVRSE